MSQINRFLEQKDLLLKILIFSFILKLALLYFLGSYAFLDGQTYINLAKEVFNNNFLFPDSIDDDAFFTPFMLSFFVPLEQFLGQKSYVLPMIILSTLTIVFIHKITLMIFEDLKSGNLVAIITAIYPFLNFYAISILTETIFIFFLYGSFYFLIKFFKNQTLLDLFYFGLFFGFVSLTRFTAVPMFFVFLLLLAIVVFKINRTLIVRSFLIASFGYMVAMSPWVVRNYKITNSIVLTSPTTKAGYAFYIGNNHLNKTGGGNGWDFDITKFRAMADQELANRLATQESLNWIKNNFSDWLILEWKKFITFFNVFLNTKVYGSTLHNFISLFSYGIVAILFIPSLIFFRDKILLLSPMILFTLMLTAIHMILFASIRYRLPIEPFMIITSVSFIKLRFFR